MAEETAAVTSPIMLLALDHHRDACLDNHDEDTCVAIQFAVAIESMARLLQAASCRYQDKQMIQLWSTARDQAVAFALPPGAAPNTKEQNITFRKSWDARFERGRHE